jgi:hypothetical protein
MPLKDPEARRAYHREYMRSWYRQNRETHLQRVLRAKRRQRALALQLVDQARHRPCMDCGVRYPTEVMDLDRLPGAGAAPGSILRGGRSKLVAEIEKSDVVCANCGRLRTRLRLAGLDVKPSQVVQRLGRDWVSVLVYS